MNAFEAIARNAENWETLSFFLMAGVFSLWERFRPARRVDHFADLKLDLLSFAVAVGVNRVSVRVLSAAVPTLAPDFFRVSLAAIHSLPGAVKIALAVVVADFMIYWIHRAQHRFDCVWRTHRWHHSVEQMYWFAGFRVSFLHSFLYNIPQTVVPMQIFGLSPMETAIGYSIALFIQFWEHTNVRVNIGPLKYILITPQYHRVHHSATRYMRMNLGPTFSLWDVMFGTYVDPESMPESFPLGMGEPWRAKQLPRMMLGV